MVFTVEDCNYVSTELRHLTVIRLREILNGEDHHIVYIPDVAIVIILERLVPDVSPFHINNINKIHHPSPEEQVLEFLM
jgi:hypothetical protein